MHYTGCRRWQHLLLLAVLVMAVYGPTVRYGLSFSDDDQLIVGNYQFNRHPGNIPQVFSRDVFFTQTLMYRPVLNLSFMVDSWIGKTAPGWYHLTNVILHALTVCLVYVLLVEMAVPQAAALSLSLLFAVHPALTMAVAWIPGRNDVILGFWAVLSALSLLMYLRGRTWALLLHCVSFGTMLFTKESAVFLTPVLIALAVRYRGWRRRTVLLIAFWTFASIAWLLIRESVIGLNYPLIVHRQQALGIATAGLLQYLGKTAIPVQLSPMPLLTALGVGTGIAAVVVLIMLFFRIPLRDRWMYVIGLLWFIAMLAPTLLYSVTSEDFFLEHRLYVPMIGLLIACAQLRLGMVIANRALKIIAVAAVIAGCALMTMTYRRAFTNGIVFWKTAVLSAPGSSIAHNGLGSVLIARGDVDEARGQFLEALRLDPHNVQAQKHLELIAAGAQHNAPLGAGTNAGSTVPARVLALLQQGDYAAAAPLLHDQLHRRPHDPVVLFYSGFVAGKLQRYQQAAICYQQALALGLDSINAPYAYYNLALIYHSNDDTARSRQALDSAYRLRPDWKGAKE